VCLAIVQIKYFEHNTTQILNPFLGIPKLREFIRSFLLYGKFLADEYTYLILVAFYSENLKITLRIQINLMEPEHTSVSVEVVV